MIRGFVVVAIAVAGGAAACVPATEAPSDAGTCDVPDGYRAGAGCNEPLRRAAAVACTAPESGACTPDDNNGPGSCAVDGDCASGACIDYYDGCFCGPGRCQSDDDCADGFACICSGAPHTFRNACLPAECRTDADCDSGRCVLSLGGTTTCCDYGDTLGLFCARPEDECASDADCNGAACIFDRTAGHFVCGDGAGCICD